MTALVRRLVAALALLGVVALPAAAQPAAVAVGVEVQPDTVRVGEPFLVSVRVRAPLGDWIVFPPGPDTSEVVQALDPPDVRGGRDTAAVDRTAYYRVAAWDVGEREVHLAAVRVRSAEGEREYALPAPHVFVASVLPADTSLRVPKPARPPVEFPRPWWLPWLIGLVVAGLIGLLVWWWWRRRRHRLPPPRPQLEPYAEAEVRFAQLEALHLVEAGERGRYVALAVEVLRDYLARRFAQARPSLTSGELLRALRETREVPNERLALLLHEGDLVKFARRPLSDEQARALGRESRAIVQAVHAASQPPAGVEPAERARGVA
ncbi:MAG TPA: hypothetical protein VFS08_00650 [Gemmatimonadaceae bacterium]|nr:hypothetical protein [Gemmatimonadaceae bacterium]